MDRNYAAEWEAESTRMIDAACDEDEQMRREYIQDMLAEAYYEELLIARMQGKDDDGR